MVLLKSIKNLGGCSTDLLVAFIRLCHLATAKLDQISFEQNLIIAIKLWVTKSLVHYRWWHNSPAPRQPDATLRQWGPDSWRRNRTSRRGRHLGPDLRERLCSGSRRRPAPGTRASGSPQSGNDLKSRIKGLFGWKWNKPNSVEPKPSWIKWLGLVVERVQLFQARADLEL